MRELRNYLERAAAISPADTIDADQIPELSPDADIEVAMPEPVPRRLEELEREHILNVLRQSEGNRERAAAILGISSRTLYRKLREYERTGIDYEPRSQSPL